MARIKGILFDKDGTLIDFDRTWFAIADHMALKAANGAREEADRLLAIAGYDFAAKRFQADSVFAAGTNADIIALWYPHQTDAERMATLDECNRFTSENGGGKPHPLNGIKETLTALHGSGYRLGVATNDSTTGAERTLSSLGMAQLFDAVYGYDAVANPKPAADTIRAFCDLTGLKPAEVAMVGDNRHDLVMARNGDCGLAVAVLSGTGTRETLAPMADAVIGSVVELPALLAERG
ncbi:MAG: HAD family hydrolase [Rhizobiaceae bacterium]|nr:MAG: HAD family hydrolase [Rhizobiaceae bacterium]